MEEQEETTEGNNGSLSKYGLIPYCLAVCKETRYNIQQVYEQPICFTLTIMCYIIDKQKIEEKQIKQLQRKHR